MNIVIQDDTYVVPCKIGDTVYMVTTAGVELAVVDRIIICANNELKIRARRMTPGLDIIYLYLDHYNNKWFLHYEEADAAFKQYKR